MKETKKQTIQLRVTATEKDEIRRSAELKHFDNVSQYLLWLHRKYGSAE